MKAKEPDPPIDEMHALLLPDVEIVMPSGDTPVVRDGTRGGIPAYEADLPKPKPTPLEKKKPAKKGSRR